MHMISNKKVNDERELCASLIRGTANDEINEARFEPLVKLDCDAMGGHADRCVSMSGPFIWWRCARCGRQYSTPNENFSL